MKSRRFHLNSSRLKSFFEKLCFGDGKFLVSSGQNPKFTIDNGLLLFFSLVFICHHAELRAKY